MTTDSTDPVSLTVESAQSNRVSARGQTRLDTDYAERIAKLFEAEYTRLVNYMFARTGSLPEAHDVAAQAFAQILEIHDPKAVSFLKAYVYSAARHIWIDRCRLGAIHRRIEPVACYECDTTSPSPEPLLIDGQQAQVLRQAIESLKPRLQMVLILRIWDDLTYREIAARLANEGVFVDERTASNWFKDALEELGMIVQCLTDDSKREGAK